MQVTEISKIPIFREVEKAEVQRLWERAGPAAGGSAGAKRSWSTTPRLSVHRAIAQACPLPQKRRLLSSNCSCKGLQTSLSGMRQSLSSQDGITEGRRETLFLLTVKKSKAPAVSSKQREENLKDSPQT